MTLLEKLVEASRHPLINAYKYCPDEYRFAEKPAYCPQLNDLCDEEECEKVCAICWLREYKGGE